MKPDRNEGHEIQKSDDEWKSSLTPEEYYRRLNTTLLNLARHYEKLPNEKQGKD